MITTIIVCLITCLLMILSILFLPKIKFSRFSIPTYLVATITGALVLVIFNKVDLKQLFQALTSNSAVNPLKILVLFLSMSGLSIFLDELGFFKYLAFVTLKKAKTGQVKLFLYLYVIVSILTVFTSNDVIVLSFTPFICYFTKNAKINPLPYLAAEFIAANTWSMALIIGNPTNIYLATSLDISFISYLKVMIIPTLFAGITAFLLLFLLFSKQLKKPISCSPEEVKIKNKPLLIIGIMHLIICTIFLAIGSYINVEMWIVSLLSFISLMVTSFIASILQKRHKRELIFTIQRLPFELIPFMLSMFVLIVALNQNGVTKLLFNILNADNTILSYGVSSFFISNLINNIPMSVLFSSIVSLLQGSLSIQAVFSTIIGSNLGAFFTPIGALAGIMWTNILSKHDVKFGYLSFLKIGVLIALPTLLSALLGLSIVL